MTELDTQPSGHPAMDYAEHERTYRMFLRLIQYTLAGVVVILVLLAIFFG